MVQRRVKKPARAAPKRRRIRLDNDQRRAQLLALARAAFSDRSYDDVSIDDLARDASISKGLLYHYFPTKRDLYLTCLHEIADELIAGVAAAVNNELPPIVRVRNGLDAYLGHVARHSRAFVALMRGGIGSDPEVAAVIEGVRSGFIERFLVGSPFGALFAADPRFQIALRGWIGFVEAASIDWCANAQMTSAELRDLLAEVLLSLLTIVGPKTFGR